MMKTITINGADNRQMLTDIHLAGEQKLRVLIFAHGFCGFKDWGNFNLVANQYCEAGFHFVKFNFSHNGTTLSSPEDFNDLEAFGNNNYSKEIFDLEQVIKFVENPGGDFEKYFDTEKIGLIGHSMGGGISILTAARNMAVKALNTWASIVICKTPWTNWSEDKIAEWKQTGIAYYKNGRTKQDMPLYYQLHEDFENHRLNWI